MRVGLLSFAILHADSASLSAYSSMLVSASYLFFFSAIEKFLLTFGFLNLAVFYLCQFSSVLIGFLLSWRSTVKRRWRSLPTSAPLFTMTSWRECFQRPLIKTWSSWFLTFPSGEIHVNLRISWCSKMVPPITRALQPQIPANLLSHQNHFPIIFSLPSLERPTSAFRPPITSTTSCEGTLSSAFWFCW